MWDFLDHIILRLLTNKNMRTHFPIIIETNKHRLFSKDIFDMLNKKNNLFPFIEL